MYLDWLKSLLRLCEDTLQRFVCLDSFHAERGREARQGTEGLQVHTDGGRAQQLVSVERAERIGSQSVGQAEMPCRTTLGRNRKTLLVTNETGRARLWELACETRTDRAQRTLLTCRLTVLLLEESRHTWLGLSVGNTRTIRATGTGDELTRWTVVPGWTRTRTLRRR